MVSISWPHDPPASASQSAGITGVSHHAWPVLSFSVWGTLLFLKIHLSLVTNTKLLLLCGPQQRCLNSKGRNPVNFMHRTTPQRSVRSWEFQVLAWNANHAHQLGNHDWFPNTISSGHTLFLTVSAHAVEADEKFTLPLLALAFWRALIKKRNEKII